MGIQHAPRRHRAAHLRALFGGDHTRIDAAVVGLARQKLCLEQGLILGCHARLLPSPRAKEDGGEGRVHQLGLLVLQVDESR